MRCPICKKPVEEPLPGAKLGNFPFCSDRCKLIDLGRWLSDAYQIPVRDPDEADADPSSYADPESDRNPSDR